MAEVFRPVPAHSARHGQFLVNKHRFGAVSSVTLPVSSNSTVKPAPNSGGAAELKAGDSYLFVSRWRQMTADADRLCGEWLPGAA
jgi:hypothetical protein